VAKLMEVGKLFHTRTTLQQKIDYRCCGCNEICTACMHGLLY